MQSRCFLLIGVLLLCSYQANCQLQALRFFIPAGERAILGISSRTAATSVSHATVSAGTLAGGMALSEGIQSGIITVDKTRYGTFELENRCRENIIVAIPTSEIDLRTAQIMLRQIGYSNLGQFQLDFGLPLTGGVDQVTLQAMQLAIDEVNQRVVSTNSYSSIVIARDTKGNEDPMWIESMIERYAGPRKQKTIPSTGSSSSTFSVSLTPSEKQHVHLKVKELLAHPPDDFNPPIGTKSIDVLTPSEAPPLKAFPFNNDQVLNFQRFLNIRGYYSSSINGIWGRNTESAAKAYFAETHRAKFSLERFNEQITQDQRSVLFQLRILGYGVPMFPDNKYYLMADHIGCYQEFKNLPITGILNQGTLDVLNQEARIAVEMVQLTLSNKNFSHYLKERYNLIGKPSPIEASHKIGDKTFFLIDNRTFPTPRTEIWSCDKSFPKRSTAAEGYENVIGATAELFKKSAGNYHLLTMLPDKTRKKIVFLLDNRKIELDESSFEGSIAAGLDQLRDLFPMHQEANKQTYIIKYSIFDKYFLNTKTNEVAPTTDYKFTNEDLYDYLNCNYGNSNDFFLADDLNIAIKNLKTLPKIRNNGDLKIAYSTGAIDDDKIVHTLIDNHDESMFVKGLAPIPNTNIILVTGHKDQNLLDFIRNHGKIGNLKNKVLVVFSCFDKADGVFYSELIKEFGLKQVIYFPIEIRSSHTEIVLDKLLELVKTRTTGKDGNMLQMSEAIREVLEQLQLTPERGVDLDELLKLKCMRNKLSFNTKFMHKTYIG